MFPGLARPGATLDSLRLTLTPAWRGSSGGSQRQGPLPSNFLDKFPLLYLTTKVLHRSKKEEELRESLYIYIYIY